MGHLVTLAKETQEDRWPSRTAVMMCNAGCSRASFPGVMAAVELESMAGVHQGVSVCSLDQRSDKWR